MAIETTRNVDVWKKDGYTCFRYFVPSGDVLAGRVACFYLADPGGNVILNESPVIFSDPITYRSHQEMRDRAAERIAASDLTSAKWEAQPKRTTDDPPQWVRWALTRTGHDFTAIAPGEPEPI